MVLMLIATQVNPKDVSDRRRLFQTMDTDDNGSLTLQELQRGLGDLDDGPDLIKQIMKADLDNSGEISYTEFLAATLSEEIYMREDYFDAAFKMLDKDNSGTLSRDEIRAGLVRRADPRMLHVHTLVCGTLTAADPF